MHFQSINPYNNEIVGEYPLHNDGQITATIANASEGWNHWKQNSYEERADKILKLAELLAAQKLSLAQMMSQEMGKLIVEAETEIEKCILGCQYYVENAERFLKSQDTVTDAVKSYVRYDPIGAVLAIMPWNFPFWQVLRFAVPTLLAGNVAILKHAPNVTGCSLALASLFEEADFAKGVFQSLVVEVPAVERVLQNGLVQAVTLTGSSRAGASVAALAGENIKKSVLELGGSDPFVVLDDADLEKAATIGARSRMANAGQSCIAAKRMIVTEQVADEFTELLKEQLIDLEVGDPLDRKANLAPMARRDLAENLERQLQTTIQEGAELELGGARKDCHFEATLLTGVRPGMTAFQEETFGPLACITTVKDDEEAVEVANDSAYGLGGSIWSNDLERAQFLAGRINTGGVFINSLMRSDPRLPFGGVKQSGYGRELSNYGIKEFVNAKTIYVDE